MLLWDSRRQYFSYTSPSNTIYTLFVLCAENATSCSPYCLLFGLTWNASAPQRTAQPWSVFLFFPLLKFLLKILESKQIELLLDDGTMNSYMLRVFQSPGDHGSGLCVTHSLLNRKIEASLQLRASATPQTVVSLQSRMEPWVKWYESRRRYDSRTSPPPSWLVSANLIRRHSHFFALSTHQSLFALVT